MPYIVTNGEVHDGDKHYVVGQFVPGARGALADMEAVGAVAWKEAGKPPAKAAKTSSMKRVKS